jgi:hypothetical protein
MGHVIVACPSRKELPPGSELSLPVPKWLVLGNAAQVRFSSRWGSSDSRRLSEVAAVM